MAKESVSVVPLEVEIHEIQRVSQLLGGRLNLRGIVEGTLSGQHRSPRQGMSLDFAQHRDYAPGDDLKHLDWRAYAKSDRYVVKQYVAETNLRAFMSVDRSMSMNYCGGGLYSKGVYASQLVAALSWTLLGQGEAVGLITFADQVQQLLPAYSRRDQFWRILRELEAQPWRPDTNASASLLKLPSRLPPRGVIFVITDGFDFSGDHESGRFAEAVMSLKNHGYQVILIHTLDPNELEFPFNELSLFEGLEGEEPIKIDPAGVRRAYLKEMRDFCQSLERSCLAVGARYFLCRTDLKLENNLLKLLEKTS